MNGGSIWLMVALGLAVVVVRRRSIAVGLVTAQALVLVGIALTRANTANEVLAALVLAVRAVGLAGLFLFLVRRTRETRPVRAAIAPLVRAGMAVGFALALTWLVPAGRGLSHQTYQAVLALVAFGITAVATRYATLLQVLGLIVVENGLAMAALTLPGGSSLLIELGVTLDLTLIAVVAGAFHFQIFSEFGAGDAAALRSLRD